MKKTNYALMFIAALFLFIVSYALDEQTSILFKNFRLPLFDIFLSVATNFGILILAMVFIPSIALYKKKRESVYLLWITFVISFVLAFIMKLIFLRQRPFEAFTYPFTTIISYSFPSMHSMIAFSLMPILIKCFPKQKIFWAVFAFLVSFSRIYFGFHFLSDVVFGAASGYIISHFLLTQKFSSTMH